MFEKLLTKLAKFLYPERDVSVERVGRRMFLHARDTTGCNSYLLEGTYSYDEVVKLNALTGYSAGFGFCRELGSIAFIGIPNSEYANSSGYFKYKVHSYGTPFDDSEYYFEAYTESEAKKIGYYTVYGLYGLNEVSAAANIKDMDYVYDSRYKEKESKIPKIYNMDCKLKGVYSYNDAKVLSTGTTKHKTGYSGAEQPILFATLGNGKKLGIIGMWPTEVERVKGFRDVWEYGCEQPQIQTIRFLADKEASEINDFELYVYRYACSGVGKD